MRMLVGYVLLAPMCGLLAYLTVGAQLALGVWFLNGSPSNRAAVSLALAVMIFAAPIATIFGAVPGVAWLIRHERLTLPNLLLAGVAIGNLPIAILVLLAHGTPSLMPVLLGSWFGGWSALFFWFVAIRGTELDQR